MAKRVYTEEYIQNIADAIRTVKEVEKKYTVAEMAAAIEEIETGLSTDNFYNIMMNDLSRRAGASVGNESSMIFFPSNDHYSIMAFSNKVTIGLAMMSKMRGNFNIKLEFQANYIYYSTHGSTLDRVGKEVYYPINLSDLTLSGNQLNYLDSSINTRNYYTKPLFIRNLNKSNCHPLILRVFDNERIGSLQELDNEKKLSDFINIVPNSGHTIDGVLIFNNSGVTFVIYNVGSNTRFIYNTSTNQIVRYMFYYKSYLYGSYIFTPNKYMNFEQQNGGNISVSQNDLSNYFVWNTYDIKDQNGNVILPANCSLSDFGL